MPYLVAADLPTIPGAGVDHPATSIFYGVLEAAGAQLVVKDVAQCGGGAS